MLLCQNLDQNVHKCYTQKYSQRQKKKEVNNLLFIKTKYLLSVLKKLGSRCFKKSCWIWCIWIFYFFWYGGGRIMIGQLSVYLVSDRAIHLAGKGTIYYTICTSSTSNTLKSSIGRVRGCRIVERVVDTLLNLSNKGHPYIKGGKTQWDEPSVLKKVKRSTTMTDKLQIRTHLYGQPSGSCSSCC